MGARARGPRPFRVRAVTGRGPPRPCARYGRRDRCGAAGCSGRRCPGVRRGRRDPRGRVRGRRHRGGAAVGTPVREVLGVVAVDRGVGALLQPGPVLRGVGGQEAGESREFDDGEQAAGGEQFTDAAQYAVGVGHVVQRGGGPYEVRCAEVGPVVAVEVGLHGPYPSVDPTGARLLAQEPEVPGRGVDGGDLCVGEAVEEGEGAGAGAASEIHDPARFAPQGQPGGDVRRVLGEHLGVEVEDLGWRPGRRCRGSRTGRPRRRWRAASSSGTRRPGWSRCGGAGCRA